MITYEQGQQVTALIAIGQQLANTAWNIGRYPDRYTDRSQELCRDLADRWDSLKSSSRSILEEIQDLPPAFDRAYLGC